MKVKFKQKDKHSCGLYALANVTGDSFYITDERLKDGERGHVLTDLNRYLSEDSQNCYLETIYKSIFTIEMPLDVTPIPTNISHVLPLLATVRFSENGINHMISMHVKNDKSILVFDSCQDEVLETSWDGIREYYPFFIGLFAFMRIESEEYIMFDYYKLNATP